MGPSGPLVARSPSKYNAAPVTDPQALPIVPFCALANTAPGVVSGGQGHDAFHATLENDGLSQAEQRVLGHRFEGGHPPGVTCTRMLSVMLRSLRCWSRPAEPGVVKARPSDGGPGVAHGSGRAPERLVEGGVEGGSTASCTGLNWQMLRLGRSLADRVSDGGTGAPRMKSKVFGQPLTGSSPCTVRVSPHGGERDGLALCEHGVRVAGERQNALSSMTVRKVTPGLNCDHAVGFSHFRSKGIKRPEQIALPGPGTIHLGNESARRTQRVHARAQAPIEQGQVRTSGKSGE